MRDKIIRIQWSSPVPVDEAIQSEDSLEPGLYFITRPWGGKDTSLYIGKASRTIRERLIDHKKHWLHRYQPLYEKMIIWISGPYGVGKFTLAEAMAARMGNALIFDAEEVGNAVRENYPDCPYECIFEDYPLWGEFCYLLLKDVHEKFYKDILVPMTLLRTESYSIIEKLLRDGKITFFIEKRGYRAVGMCSVAMCFSTFACSDTGAFDDFYIEPVFRRKGIARMLAQAAQNWSTENGLASLTVTCAPCDEGMYQSLGFDVKLGSTFSVTP